MKCPWCNSTLVVIETVNKSTWGNPMESEPSKLKCKECETTGTVEWWNARAKDQRGLPKGDR